MRHKDVVLASFVASTMFLTAVLAEEPHSGSANAQVLASGECQDDDSCIAAKWGPQYTCGSSEKYCDRHKYTSEMACCPFTCKKCATSPPSSHGPTLKAAPSPVSSACKDDDSCLQASWGPQYTCASSSNYCYKHSYAKQMACCPFSCGRCPKTAVPTRAPTRWTRAPARPTPDHNTPTRAPTRSTHDHTTPTRAPTRWTRAPARPKIIVSSQRCQDNDKCLQTYPKWASYTCKKAKDYCGFWKYSKEMRCCEQTCGKCKTSAPTHLLSPEETAAVKADQKVARQQRGIARTVSASAKKAKKAMAREARVVKQEERTGSEYGLGTAREKVGTLEKSVAKDESKLGKAEQQEGRADIIVGTLRGNKRLVEHGRQMQTDGKDKQLQASLQKQQGNHDFQRGVRDENIARLNGKSKVPPKDAHGCNLQRGEVFCHRFRKCLEAWRCPAYMKPTSECGANFMYCRATGTCSTGWACQRSQLKLDGTRCGSLHFLWCHSLQTCTALWACPDRQSFGPQDCRKGHTWCTLSQSCIPVRALCVAHTPAPLRKPPPARDIAPRIGPLVKQQKCGSDKMWCPWVGKCTLASECKYVPLQSVSGSTHQAGICGRHFLYCPVSGKCEAKWSCLKVEGIHEYQALRTGAEPHLQRSKAVHLSSGVMRLTKCGTGKVFCHWTMRCLPKDKDCSYRPTPSSKCAKNFVWCHATARCTAPWACYSSTVAPTSRTSTFVPVEAHKSKIDAGHVHLQAKPCPRGKVFCPWTRKCSVVSECSYRPASISKECGKHFVWCPKTVSCTPKWYCLRKSHGNAAWTSPASKPLVLDSFNTRHSCGKNFVWCPKTRSCTSHWYCRQRTRGIKIADIKVLSNAPTFSPLRRIRFTGIKARCQKNFPWCAASQSCSAAWACMQGRPSNSQRCDIKVGLAWCPTTRSCLPKWGCVGGRKRCSDHEVWCPSRQTCSAKIACPELKNIREKLPKSQAPSLAPPPRVFNSCQGRCGDWANTKRSCYCDYNCMALGDCCADYSHRCKALPRGSKGKLRAWKAEGASYFQAVREPKPESWMTGEAKCTKASFELYSPQNSCYNRNFATKLVFPLFSDLSTGRMSYSNGADVHYVEGLRVDVENLCKFTNCTGFTCWNPRKYFYPLPEEACMSNDPRVYAKWQLCSKVAPEPPAAGINPGPRAPLWKMRCESSNSHPAKAAHLLNLASTNETSATPSSSPTTRAPKKYQSLVKLQKEVSKMGAEFANLARASGTNFQQAQLSMEQDGVGKFGQRNGAVVSSVEASKLDMAPEKDPMNLPGSPLMNDMAHIMRELAREGAFDAGTQDSNPEEFKKMYSKIEQALLQQVPQHNLLDEELGHPMVLREKDLHNEIAKLDSETASGEQGSYPNQKARAMQLATVTQQGDGSERKLWNAARKMIGDHSKQKVWDAAAKMVKMAELSGKKIEGQQAAGAGLTMKSRQLWAKARAMIANANPEPANLPLAHARGIR